MKKNQIRSVIKEGGTVLQNLTVSCFFFKSILYTYFVCRTCNNEVLKMQKLGVADVQLQNMQVSTVILLYSNRICRSVQLYCCTATEYEGLYSYIAVQQQNIKVRTVILLYSYRICRSVQLYCCTATDYKGQNSYIAVQQQNMKDCTVLLLYSNRI